MINIEVLLYLCAWITCILTLLILVPKNMIREAQVIFLFKQVLTWLFGLMVVEFKLIEYPVRLFPYANRTSFSFEYFIYPAICVIFNLYYPKTKRILPQLRHYFVFCTTITVIEIFTEKYTDIINYLYWHWSLTLVTLFITFYLSRKFYTWFFKP